MKRLNLLFFLVLAAWAALAIGSETPMAPGVPESDQRAAVTTPEPVQGSLPSKETVVGDPVTLAEAQNSRPEDALLFPLQPGFEKVEVASACESCCASCDDRYTRIPCNQWCGCWCG